jgi:WD40 repeat protein
MRHVPMRSSLLLLTVLLAGPAFATTRVAVLVGANAGWGNDRPLRYAEEDARRLSAALTELGGFAADAVILLRTPSTEQLRAELEAVKQRLRDTPEEEALFVFYYSGHADEQHLHLRGEPLPFTELHRHLREMPAAVKLGIFDACQSGSILAAKGAQVAPAFRLTVRDEPTVRGTVILTSSGADELSQEARALSGSFFTHHLVSGLRGAADDDGDLQVSLDEVYRYASTRTQLDTAWTPAGAQRPAFLYDMKGHGGLYLSRLKGPSAFLLFPPGGQRCYVTDADERRLVAEFFPRKQGPSRLSIPPGAHLLKCVTGENYRVARLAVKAGERWDVTQLAFREVALSEGVLKGGSKDRMPVEAFAQGLAEKAEQVRPEHPEHLELSVLLAAESLRRAPSMKAQQVLRRGLERLALAGTCMTHEVPGPVNPHLITEVLWNPEETWLMKTGTDGTACVWGRDGAEWVHMAEGSLYKGMAFSPDGKVLVTATAEEPVRVWEVTTGQERRRIEGTESANLLVISPEGKLLATAHGAHAYIWEVATGREVSRVQHEGFIHALAFSPDGRLLASASQDGTARVWEASTGREHTVVRHGAAVRSLAFSPDGARLATGSEDRTARIWEVSTGKVLSLLEHRVVPCEELTAEGLTLCKMSHLMDTVSRVGTVVFSPDGQHLATESMDAVAWLWDAESGRELKRLPQRDHLRALVFSPDGKALAVASGESVARIWSVETRQELFQLNQADGIAFLQYSLDGRYLMTLSGKGKAHIWDAGTGREFASVLEDASLEAALLSPNGQHLVAARQDRDGGKLSFSVYVWWAEDLIAQACGRLRRNLSQDEWREYVGDEEPYLKTCTALP